MKKKKKGGGEMQSLGSDLRGRLTCPLFHWLKKGTCEEEGGRGGEGVRREQER